MRHGQTCIPAHFSEQGSLYCISPASEARPASNDDSTSASKARSALASEARPDLVSEAHSATPFKMSILSL
eukprot:6207913-Pleurochrysis_carterae.AAC.2